MPKLAALSPGAVRAFLLVALAITWLGPFARGGVGVPLLITVLLVGVGFMHAFGTRQGGSKAAIDAVANLPFPAFLAGKLRERHPHLDDAQLRLVERGLRQFFMAHLHAGGDYVAMPSKAVDALWHEFILDTRAYEAFCRQAFGKVLHHTPAEVPPPGEQRSTGLRLAWYWSCKEEGIDPGKPDRLPLLFAIDAMLGIPGGERYVLDEAGALARWWRSSPPSARAASAAMRAARVAGTAEAAAAVAAEAVAAPEVPGSEAHHPPG
jgi:hypothetical protein